MFYTKRKMRRVPQMELHGMSTANGSRGGRIVADFNNGIRPARPYKCSIFSVGHPKSALLSASSAVMKAGNCFC